MYSRHLQRQVKLTIISTPMPDDKTEMNLLLMNDGQEFRQLRIKEIVDSLYSKNLIKSLLIVGIHAGDRMKEYGVADYPDFNNRGDRAGYYDKFVADELYFFAKKNATVRKFIVVTCFITTVIKIRIICNTIFLHPVAGMNTNYQ